MAKRTDGGMRVHLLGPMRIQVDGVDVDARTWKSKKAVTLLKYLVGRLGERVPRDILVELLWPYSDDGAKSTHNLHTVVYYLRRALEPSLRRYAQSRFLRHAHGLYWLDADAPVSSDVQDFRRCVSLGRRARDIDPEQALQHFSRGLELYRDDFCPEDLYEDWAVTMREKLRDQYVTATIEAAELFVQVNADFDGAITLCRKALTKDPYREDLHKAIMLYLKRAGRFGEAAQQYRDCAKMLDVEFGLQPSPETAAVFEGMRNLSAPPPQTIPAASSASQPPAPAPTTPRDDDTTGPLVCNKETYVTLYRLELRRHARAGEALTLLRLTLGDGADTDATETDQRMSAEVVAQVLRAGDVICWEGTARAAVLLARTDADGAAAVERRLRYGLEKAGLVFFRIERSVIEPDAGRIEGRRASGTGPIADGTAVEAAG